MSVYDDLAQILSARYGKDVRQAIHDAIQQCYSDATGNPESVAAFADDILDLKAADNNINAAIDNLQATDNDINTLISGMQTTINGLQTTIGNMQTTISEQFNKFFPIGSLYYTGDDGFDPNTAEGWQGTWSKIEGRFILGSSEDYTVNSTGGEATHTLTVDELAPHSHTQNVTTGSGGPALRSDYNADDHGNVYSQGITTDSAGGGQPHNNMPPYEVKHIWKRTA